MENEIDCENKMDHLVILYKNALHCHTYRQTKALCNTIHIAKKQKRFTILYISPNKSSLQCYTCRQTEVLYNAIHIAKQKLLTLLYIWPNKISLQCYTYRQTKALYNATYISPKKSFVMPKKISSTNAYLWEINHFCA